MSIHYKDYNFTDLAGIFIDNWEVTSSLKSA